MPDRRSALSGIRRPTCGRASARTPRARRPPGFYADRAAGGGDLGGTAQGPNGVGAGFFQLHDEVLLLELAVVALQRLVLAAQDRLHLLHDFLPVPRPHAALTRAPG